MTQINVLQRIESNSVFRGFGNLLHKEKRQWWGTNWWLRPLLWVCMIDGLLSLVLFALPLAVALDPEQSVENYNFVSMAAQVLFQVGPFFLAAGTIIMAQDLLLGERETGIAEWILTKPVSRSAYLLSKFAACFASLFATMIIIPYSLGYIIMVGIYGAELSLSTYVASVLAVCLYLLFYLTLTLMLGVTMKTHGQLLSVSLGALFAGLIIPGFMGRLALATPWILPNLLPAWGTGSPIPFNLSTPVIMTAIWCLLFTGVALRRINQVEY